MRAKLTKNVKILANATCRDTERPILTGVYLHGLTAVATDGYILVIKTLATPEMALDAVADDGINEIIIPADALKGCPGDDIELECIETVKVKTNSMLEETTNPIKTVVRLNGDGFSVEADSIEGHYPNYLGLFPKTPKFGEVAVNTALLKKLLKSVPDNATMRLRISEPDKPIEFQCVDDDGDEPIRGIIMPLAVLPETLWKCDHAEVKEPV